MAIKRIEASTLSEFVIALSIFAICFTVASLVFLQTNRSTIQFQEAMSQTEFQSELFHAFIADSAIRSNFTLNNAVELKIEANSTSKNGLIYSLKNSSKTIWKQDFYPNQHVETQP